MRRGGIGEGHIQDIADRNAQNKRHAGFPATLKAVAKDGKDGWANGNRHEEPHAEAGEQDAEHGVKVQRNGGVTKMCLGIKP